MAAEPDNSNQLTLLGRSLGPDTVQHFSHNAYFCGSRASAAKILRDILSCVHEFRMLHRVTTWGESHGGGLGAVVDGCPPLLELSEADLQPDLDRRRPGQSSIVTQRKESDTVHIQSGVFEGKTLGTPIGMVIANEDQRSGDYREVEEVASCRLLVIGIYKSLTVDR